MMLLDWLNRPPKPDSFTKPMGERIRQARLEKGYSQEELAERIYRRRASLSEMETGKMEVDASTWFLLALNLEKPLIYFLGDKWRYMLGAKNLEMTSEQQEILKEFNRLDSSALKKAAIQQIRALANTQYGDE